MIFTGESCVPNILYACGSEIEFKQIMQIDSNEMDENVRNEILRYVKSLDYGRVVIIHGTSSILETAKLLKSSHLEGVYVLTGAMIPFRCSRTEASFNLGGAIALARYATRGVYVYMHGEIFDPLQALKDVSRARFVHVRM
jgi:L-asparaginase